MCNGGIECSLKYLLITCFTNWMFTKVSADNLLHQILAQIYSSIIHCINCRHCRHCANGKLGLIENKEMPMDICIKSACFSSDNFYVWKFYLNSVMCHPLSFIQRKMRTSISVKSFLLSFVWSWHHIKPSTMGRLSGRLSSFAEEFCSFRSIF